MSKRKNHAPAALSGEKAIAGLSSELGAHQTQTHRRVKQLKDSATGIFAGEIKTEEARKEKQPQALHAETGQLTVERDFSAEARGNGERLPQAKHGRFRPGEAQRRPAMRLAQNIPFRPALRPQRRVSRDAALKREIDKAFTEWPFLGVRQMRDCPALLGTERE